VYMTLEDITLSETSQSEEDNGVTPLIWTTWSSCIQRQKVEWLLQELEEREWGGII
jgi:hypothetical protein